MLDLPAFEGFSDQEIETMRKILNPNIEYVSLSDGVITAHEMGHMMFRPNNRVELSAELSSSRTLYETNAILMETLFEDYIRNNHPQYAKKMDYFNYDRNWESSHKMEIIREIIDLTRLKRGKGKDLDYEDLLNLSLEGRLPIDFTEGEKLNQGIDTQDAETIEKLTFIRMKKLATLIKMSFLPIASETIYEPRRQKLEFEDDDSLVAKVNTISFREAIGYPIGSILMPTIRKSFYESGREEGIKKLNKYFRLFEENNPREALRVFGIDLDTEKGIREIQNNYMDFLRELSSRLKTNIVLADNFAKDTGDELDIEDDFHIETDEEILARLSDDDGMPIFDDYQIPDEMNTREDEDDIRE